MFANLLKFYSRNFILVNDFACILLNAGEAFDELLKVFGELHKDFNFSRFGVKLFIKDL